jgi:hypothetical protein
VNFHHRCLSSLASILKAGASARFPQSDIPVKYLTLYARWCASSKHYSPETIIMTHMDIHPPLFGRIGNAPVSEWSDVDQFDVAILAEFLLDDGNLGTGSSFDFK